MQQRSFDRTARGAAWLRSSSQTLPVFLPGLRTEVSTV